MKLFVTEEVAHWYKRELAMPSNAYLRFFVRYGGFGGLVPGFSLGVNIDEPQNMHTSTTVAEITFYIEEQDVWYFDNQNLNVRLDEVLQEPTFSYQ